MTEDEIIEMAGNLSIGFICYIRKDDKSILLIPDMDEMSDTYEFWEDRFNEVKRNPDQYVAITKMDSRESFKIREDFVSTVEDEQLKNILIEALRKPKPFRNFKAAIDRSEPYRQKWFAFEKDRFILWVKKQLTLHNLYPV